MTFQRHSQIGSNYHVAERVLRGSATPCSGETTERKKTEDNKEGNHLTTVVVTNQNKALDNEFNNGIT